MIDHFKEHRQISVRLTRSVLGFRRQSYYLRKKGHRPEEMDALIAGLLHQVTKRFVAWGFWMRFSFFTSPGPFLEPQADISDMATRGTSFEVAPKTTENPPGIPGFTGTG